MFVCHCCIVSLKKLFRVAVKQKNKQLTDFVLNPSSLLRTLKGDSLPFRKNQKNWEEVMKSPPMTTSGLFISNSTNEMGSLKFKKIGKKYAPEGNCHLILRCYNVQEGIKNGKCHEFNQISK